MLDPGAPNEERIDDTTQVTLKEIRDRLNQSEDNHPNLFLPDEFGYNVKPLITIWFNAWKYENTEQVWAGLADSIIKGIANRMDPIDREWFYLMLNLRRQDRKSIRNWITARTWNFLTTKLRSWIYGVAAGIGSSFITFSLGVVESSPAFSSGGLLGIIASSVIGSLKTFTEKDGLEGQPAEVTLDKFIKVPDYKGNVGFIHHVVEDLKIVFETIPERFKKLAIFVDDLDRCSPQNVSRVMEGINLFLAGEFPGCIFVLGMDAEMVASALEKAHEDVIMKLPSYSKNIPIGWRFMDKLVQLPIMIPPLSENKMREFASGLVSNVTETKKPKSTNGTATDLSGTKMHTGKASNLPDFRHYLMKYFTLQKKDLMSKPTKNSGNRGLTLESSQREKLNEMDNKIKNISDLDKIFLDQVSAAASEFSNNPREIKRFMNVLRFQRFLLSGIPEKDKPPSFPQMRRWIVLSLKWPQVVRWLYWSSDLPGIKERLQVLEANATTFSKLEDWYKFLFLELKLTAEDDLKVQ